MNIVLFSQLMVRNPLRFASALLQSILIVYFVPKFFYSDPFNCPTHPIGIDGVLNGVKD